MKKITLALLLLIVSTNASANWTNFGSEDVTTYYVDLSTINNNGNTAKVWVLYDFKEAQKDANGYLYRSMKNQIEYQCSEKQSRLKHIVSFNRNMGNGAVLFDHTYNDESYRPVRTPSFENNVMSEACSKR